MEESTGQDILTPAVRAAETPEELEGAVCAELMRVLQAAQAKRYSRLLIRDHQFDSPGALAELTVAQLADMAVPLGHRRIICKAVFNGNVPSGLAEFPAVHQGAQAHGVQVAQATHGSRFRLDWPGGDRMPMAQELRSFMLALKVFLYQSGREDLSVLVWGAVLRPEQRIADWWVHGCDDDKELTHVLLLAGTKGVPDAVMRLVRVELEKGHGLAAVHRLCGRVFMRTTLASAGLKKRVWAPEAAKSDHRVAAALADWETDLEEAMQRGFTFDEQDKEVALYGIVDGLKGFEATVAALKIQDPSPGWRRIMDSLRERANDIMSAPAAPSNNTSRQPKQHNRKALKAMRAALKAEHAGAHKNACWDYLKGECRRGAKCKFLHQDLDAKAGAAPEKERAREARNVTGAGDKKALVAAMLERVVAGASVPLGVQLIGAVLQSSQIFLRKGMKSVRAHSSEPAPAPGGPGVVGVITGRRSGIAPSPRIERRPRALPGMLHALG